jgi:hypothetical protein
MTTTLGLVQPAIGSTAWGTALNSDLGAIDTGTALGQVNLYSPVSISGTTTLTSNAFGKIHELSGTSSAYTVTLPSAVTANIGSLIAFRGLAVGSLNQVITIAPAGTDTIDGLSSTVLLWNELVVLLCVGNGLWVRVIRKSLDQWQSFTPTIKAVTTDPTKGTPPTQNCYWKRDGGDMIIEFFYAQTAAGTAGSGTYKFLIPGGFSIDSTICTLGKFTSASDLPSIVGAGNVIAYGTSGSVLLVFAFDATNLGLFGQTTGYTPVASGFFSLANTNVNYAFQARIPISGWQ